MKQGIEQGIEQGIRQRSKEIALSLIQQKLDLDMIAQVTGLSVQELKSLSN